MTLPPAYHWDATRPPPRLVLRLAARRPIRVPDPPPDVDSGPAGRPFDLSGALHALCADIAVRSPAFAHLDTTRMAFSVIRSRSAVKHGLQARITPLRFPGGELVGRHRRRPYQVQRFTIDGREVLYLVSVVLPRFLNREFNDKLVTVFHELYHVSPAFDGVLRRHEGRYSAHSASQKKYDAHMADLAADYLRREPDPGIYTFLKLSFGQLCRRHGAIVGLHLPRPKLLPLAGSNEAASSQRHRQPEQ
jgi:hypothetical protein